jgi:hypothetical protein
MNFGMIDVLVNSHAGDIRRQAARRRTAAGGRGARPAGAAATGPRLRSRVGFALVEVGLRLQATSGPAGARRPVRG